MRKRSLCLIVKIGLVFDVFVDCHVFWCFLPFVPYLISLVFSGYIPESSDERHSVHSKLLFTPYISTPRFVCHDCKSAHQSFSHRCKSVQMSTWTMEEVKASAIGRKNYHIVKGDYDSCSSFVSFPCLFPVRYFFLSRDFLSRKLAWPQQSVSKQCPVKYRLTPTLGTRGARPHSPG